MKKTLQEIARLVDGTVMGDEHLIITGITNIDDAGPGDITFAVRPHLDKAAVSAASAVLIPVDLDVAEFVKPAIRVEDPRVAFAKLLAVFVPPLAVARQVDERAVIGSNVRLGRNVAIMPYVVLADDVVIGDNCIIYPHTYIGQHVVVGADSLIYANVTIREGCQIGDRVIIQSGAVVGSDGFGFVTVKGRHHKVPQVGNVLIEDDVEIGANACIDRATTGSTIVRRGTKIDNLVHLAHNVVIGQNCYLVAQTGIAGSVQVGDNVTFAGQSGSAGHLTIGDNCVFAAKAGIISDVPAGSFYAGFPARAHKEWLRGQAAIHKLPDLLKKVRDLEQRLLIMEERKP